VLNHGPWLKDLLIFLVSAGLIVPLFHGARIGAVLGFLLDGVAVGVC
jgi:CPA2 family monovalent cation:H+ antiporter-2